jgi:O-6-methylguanine DNA methyltransferase
MVLLSSRPAFTRRVLAAVCRLRSGQVATYGDIAAAAGQPRAYRAVGNIMRECGSRDVPCHRVIAAGGQLGGYGSNPQLKAALLRAEGLVVSGNRVKNWRERRVKNPARPASRRFRRP